MVWTMDIKSYQITDELLLMPFPPERVMEASRDKDARIWIDLMTSDSGELEEWLDRLEVKKLSRRLCLEARGRSAFYPLKDELLLIIPGTSLRGGSEEADHIVFLCRQNLLLSIHSKPIFSFQKITELQASDSWLPERSIAGLLSAMLIGMSLECLRRTAGLRDSVFALVEQMDRKPDDVEAEHIMDMRAELMTMATTVNDQLPAIEALGTSEKRFFDIGEARAYINCALVNMRSVDRSLDWLDQRVSNLLSGIHMHSQERTNRRLGRLTVLSAIFMPITLMAGIWGMNFTNMPELEFPFAYPAALGLMACIGIGMFLFFRKRGWFY